MRPWLRRSPRTRGAATPDRCPCRRSARRRAQPWNGGFGRVPLVHIASKVDSVIGHGGLDLIAEEVQAGREGVAGFHPWRVDYRARARSRLGSNFCRSRSDWRRSPRNPSGPAHGQGTQPQGADRCVNRLRHGVGLPTVPNSNAGATRYRRGTTVASASCRKASWPHQIASVALFELITACLRAPWLRCR